MELDTEDQVLFDFVPLWMQWNYQPIPNPGPQDQDQQELIAHSGVYCCLATVNISHKRCQLENWENLSNSMLHKSIFLNIQAGNFIFLHIYDKKQKQINTRFVILTAKLGIQSTYIWHRFILPLPPPFRMVKNVFFELTQIKFYKWILLLKFDTPPK